MEEEVTCNRFEGFLFRGQYEWVCLHDEQLHFADNQEAQIKLCSTSLRVRANDAWSKLPKRIKRAMVAHELGHREYQHYLNPITNPFYRMGQAMGGKVLDREIEADRHAIKLIGRESYVKALKDYIGILKGIGGKQLAIHELEMRIMKCLTTL